MDIPAVTREYTPGSCGNSRKPIRHPPHREMRPDSRALRAEQFRVPKHVRILDLLDGTPESPQQCCQETRRTMMSPQKWKIALCTPNHLEIKPISRALAS